MGLSVLVPPEFIDDILQFSPKYNESKLTDDEFQCSPDNIKPQLFTPTELNDLVRDLDFIKDKAELVCSRFKEKFLLESAIHLK